MVGISGVELSRGGLLERPPERLIVLKLGELLEDDKEIVGGGCEMEVTLGRSVAEEFVLGVDEVSEELVGGLTLVDGIRVVVIFGLGIILVRNLELEGGLEGGLTPIGRLGLIVVVDLLTTIGGGDGDAKPRVVELVMEVVLAEVEEALELTEVLLDVIEDLAEEK